MPNVTESRAEHIIFDKNAYGSFEKVVVIKMSLKSSLKQLSLLVSESVFFALSSVRVGSNVHADPGYL